MSKKRWSHRQQLISKSRPTVKTAAAESRPSVQLHPVSPLSFFFEKLIGAATPSVAVSSSVEPGLVGWTSGIGLAVDSRPRCRFQKFAAGQVLYSGFRTMNLDLSPFKLDMDELIDEFVEGGGMSLGDMKRVWLSRKFTHIFQASPSVKLALFMQSLYAHSIGYVVSTDSLSRRLGGLYCLYCLYETQPFNSPFRIYLSLGELKKLRNLVVDAKKQGVSVVPSLVKRMLEKNMFLFGAVEQNVSSHNSMVGQILELQNARVQHAYKKLFANTPISQFLHMDLGVECDSSLLKNMTTEYAEAKKLAIQESKSVSVEDIDHISDNRELLGYTVENISERWNAQKEQFYDQTGLNPNPGHEEDQQQQQLVNNSHEVDDFSRALESELLEEPEEQEGEEQNDEVGEMLGRWQ